MNYYDGRKSNKNNIFFVCAVSMTKTRVKSDWLHYNINNSHITDRDIWEAHGNVNKSFLSQKVRL